MPTWTAAACMSMSAAAYPSHWPKMESIYERLVTAQFSVERLLTQDLHDETKRVQELEKQLAQAIAARNYHYECRDKLEKKLRELRCQNKPRRGRA